MHRFYLPPERCRGETFQLDGREAHHALHVLRVKSGEAVMVLDGAGRELVCRVEGCGRDTVTLRVAKTNLIAAPACAVTLLQALPKGKTFESIIQKSVELGAHRIVPLLTERVVTRLDPASSGSDHKRDKWQQVAVEAIKQCGAGWLPIVEAPTTIRDFLARREQAESGLALAPADTLKRGLQPQRSDEFDLQLVGSLQSERRHPRDVLAEFQAQHGCAPRSVAVWIGPEGDFTPDELEAIEAAGARPITLGRLTLRVETAAIYCLSFLHYALNPEA